MRNRTLIIAEAGVNHNGDRERAIRLVQAAASAGADVVKFQSFKADRLASSRAPKANYQKATTDVSQSQLEMLRALELSEEIQTELAKVSARVGVEFMSTPFDAESADLLALRIGVSRIKISSGDLTNSPLLLHIARFGKPIILSTGMSNLQEIEAALAVIAFGLTRAKHEQPTPDALATILRDQEAKLALRQKVALLHCTTAYPAPPASINLRAMRTLRDVFELSVGFSDHSQGIHFASAAVALGAEVIEKHFTLDRSLPGPDHRASIEPDELARMIRDIREIESGLGDGRKLPTGEELENRVAARRSLVAATEIRKGEAFSEENIAVKRAGGGISPLEYWAYLGRLAKRDYQPGELIEP